MNNFDTLFLPHDGIQAIKARFDDQLPARFMGMRVFESPLARMPARVHKRRRGMSEAYHRRVQKKWNKRFGYVPAAFFVDSRKILGAITFPKFDISGDSSNG
jgi:hypothetical protein